MIQVAKKASVLKRRNTKQRMESRDSPCGTPSAAAATAATTPATPATATTNSTALAGTPSGAQGECARRDSEGDVVFYIDDASKAGQQPPCINVFHALWALLPIAVRVRHRVHGRVCGFCPPCWSCPGIDNV